MRSARRTIIVLAIAALLAAPPAAIASSKLFTVSLSGRDTADVTRSFTVPPNSERCTGTPNARFGWLDFKARITRPRYTARRDTSGDWGIDLGEDPDLYPREPGECEFTHAHEALKCHWWRKAKSRGGWWFTLVPVDGRYNLIVDLHFNSMLECQRRENLQLIQEGPPRTKLVIPYDYDVDDPAINEHRRGQERLRYTLTVRRVR
jgi:hypothetical protein